MKIRDERGMTLVEVLISTVILGIIMGAISASIIVGLRTTGATHTRIAESHDAKMTTTYFVPDMQSASDVSLTDSACAATTPVVRFRWDDESVTKVASYFARTSGGERQLVRRYCEDGSLTSEIIVAHNLASTGPTVTCTPACPPATPAKVVLAVTTVGGYSFQVSAARRTT